MTKAWHFVGETLRDGRPVPKNGVWLEHEGHVMICSSGLHASLEPFDALQYAPGGILCLVECEDIVESEKNKLVCRRRKIIQRMDATCILRYFARMQALSCIHLWDAPQVVCDYLMTGNEKIRDAARVAAWDAAQAAAWDARVARDAARAAAWDAAQAAAWDARVARDAARAAVRAAARGAAWDAARGAAWAAARKDFNNLVYECFEDWL